jgi:hypothetical protein
MKNVMAFGTTTKQVYRNKSMKKENNFQTA